MSKTADLLDVVDKLGQIAAMIAFVTEAVTSSSDELHCEKITFGYQQIMYRIENEIEQCVNNIEKEYAATKGSRSK